MLTNASNVAPHVQTAPEEAIYGIFPDDDWQVHASENGVRTLAMKQSNARITLPQRAVGERVFFSMRCYGAPTPRPYRVEVTSNGETTGAKFEVLQGESFQLCGNTESATDHLTLSTTYLDDAADLTVPAFSFSDARIIVIDPEETAQPKLVDRLRRAVGSAFGSRA